MVDVNLAIQQRNLERQAAGLPPLQGEEQQLFTQQFEEQQQREEMQQQLDAEQAQRDAEADLVTQAMLSAGMPGLAREFRAAQRAAAFDEARRGTERSSIAAERAARIRNQAALGAAGLFGQATATGEQVRQQGLGSVFGLQQQVAQQDPFAGGLQAGLLQGVQGRTNAILGDAQTSQQMANINQRFNQQLGTALGFGLQGLGAAIGGGIRGQQAQPQQPTLDFTLPESPVQPRSPDPLPTFGSF